MSSQRRQMFRFALIGVASTGLYFGLLMALRSTVPSIIVLTALCYGISMCFNFLAQGMFTFQLRSLSSRQMSRYIVMHLSALLMNSLAMAILVDGFGLQLLAAQVIVTGGVTVVTFLLSRNWVYA